MKIIYVKCFDWVPPKNLKKGWEPMKMRYFTFSDWLPPKSLKKGGNQWKVTILKVLIGQIKACCKTVRIHYFICTE